MADWQVGDLALCIKVGPWVHAGTNTPSLNDPVRGGMVLTVRRIGTGLWGRKVLWFVGVGGHIQGDSYSAERFIKITPPEADAFDREVIEQMRGEPVEAQP